MKNLYPALLTALLMMITGNTPADKLLIEVIEDVPSNSSSGIPRPVRGQDMAQVSAQFGEPKTRMAPVGNPPITRWVYEQYTVYFEHQTVLKSVINRANR